MCECDWWCLLVKYLNSLITTTSHTHTSPATLNHKQTRFKTSAVSFFLCRHRPTPLHSTPLHTLSFPLLQPFTFLSSKMREIVHLQTGQCGNQVRKEKTLRRLRQHPSNPSILPYIHTSHHTIHFLKIFFIKYHLKFVLFVECLHPSIHPSLHSSNHPWSEETTVTPFPFIPPSISPSLQLWYTTFKYFRYHNWQVIQLQCSGGGDGWWCWGDGWVGGWVDVFSRGNSLCVIGVSSWLAEFDRGNWSCDTRYITIRFKPIMLNYIIFIRLVPSSGKSFLMNTELTPLVHTTATLISNWNVSMSTTMKLLAANMCPVLSLLIWNLVPWTLSVPVPLVNSSDL